MRNVAAAWAASVVWPARAVRPLRAALAFALLAGCAVAPEPVASVAGTPADDGVVAFAPYSEKVAARFPPPPRRYLTPGLEPGRTQYTTNDELNAALAAIAASPRAGVSARLLEAGSSSRGHPLRALHLGAGSAAAAGRPTVLLIGQQHGDEPAPAEALLVVATELARGALSPLLASIDVLILPRANPDGAEVGRRVNAGGFDLNRDHLLLRTPEVRAITELARRHRPALVVDLHEHTVVGRYLEKFNAIQRNDLLLQYATTPNLPEALVQASEQRFRQPLLSALAREGLTVEWYYTNSLAPDDRRLAMGGVRPDIGRNVYGLRNAVSVLLETRGVGIGRLHLARRVHTHVVATTSLLHSAAREAASLLKLQREVDAAVASQACSGQIDVDAEATPTRRLITMIDPDTGADRPIEVEWISSLELRPTTRRARPCGYWLAADAADAVDRLRRLGVDVRRFAEPAELAAERWRESERSEAARADVRGTIADAGAEAVRVRVTVDRAALQAPPGSHYVGLDQPLAHLAVAALEPDTQSSYFANRVIGSLAQAARVMEPPRSRLEPVP